MLKVNIGEVKTHFSKYAAKVKAGETIVLCDRNVPFGEIRPLVEAEKKNNGRPLGFLNGKVILSDDWNSEETNNEIAESFYDSPIFPK